jgi:hypothetical protein
MFSNNPTSRKRAVSYSANQVRRHHNPSVHEHIPSSMSSSPKPREQSTPSRRPASRHRYAPDNVVPDRIHPSFPSPHNPSTQSSPLTSPSSAHDGSSRFTDSQSSFTSESASPSADPRGSRSVFDDNRVPATSLHPYFGTPSSPALSGRSRSITESDLLPMHAVTYKRASKYPPSAMRARTAPNSPSLPTLETPEPPVAMGIKSFLSKPALPSPTRLSLHSDSAISSHSRLTTPRKSKSHPPELDVSAVPFSPGYVHPDPATSVNTSPSSSIPLVSQDNLSTPTNSMPTRGKGQRQRNVLRRKPSAKAKERMQRDMEIKQMAITASPSPSPRVHGSASKDFPPSTVAQLYDESSMQPTEARSEDDLHSPSPMPYYTVYGTQSEHRITAGEPDDNSNWSFHAHVLAEQRAQTQHSEPSRSLSRKGSLSRRVSNKWKKATGEGVKADESPLRDPSNGRSSLQERRSSRCLKDRGQSTDTGVCGNGHIRSVTDPQSKSDGSKIWKLVKRISTGALRERFHADTAAPPVPAIPKELLKVPPPRPQTAHKDGQATSQRSYSASVPRNIASSGPRPSMATSSSSPNSSEMASASFFHVSHSRGSSVSSYGEETVPGFPSMGDRHIVPPRELHKISGDHRKDQGSMSHSGRCSYSSGRSYSGRVTPTVEGKDDDEHQETSTRTHIIPITHPIHSLTSLRTHKLIEKPPTTAHTHLLPDGNTSLSPPPRLARGAMRSNGLSESEPSPSQSMFATADEEPDPRTSLRAPSTLSEASTAKMRMSSRSSTSTSRDASSSQLRSAVNYRELNAPRRPPLTEREKADIWNDLLERSAQAGGTLHLGGGELESDNLRFSTYSELS